MLTYESISPALALGLIDIFVMKFWFQFIEQFYMNYTFREAFNKKKNIFLFTAQLKLRKTESSRLKEIPLQMLPMGMWGPENMKIKKVRWGLFDF